MFYFVQRMHAGALAQPVIFGEKKYNRRIEKLTIATVRTILQIYLSLTFVFFDPHRGMLIILEEIFRCKRILEPTMSRRVILRYYVAIFFYTPELCFTCVVRKKLVSLA